MQGRTGIFIFLVGFWVMLAILSNMFQLSLSESHISEYLPGEEPDQETSKGLISNIFDTLEDIPGVSVFVPLMEIMAFQYTDEVPIALTLILDSFGLITMFIMVTIVRGN